MIEIKNITFSYPDADILKGVGFSAQCGEVVGLLGNNGAGKSTLITCLNRIRTPDSGSLHIDGKNAFQMSRNELARTVAYVAQKNELTHSTVFDCVLLGRKPYIKWSVSQEDIDICTRKLSLSLREVRAIACKHSGISLGKSCNEVVCACKLSRGYTLIICSVELSVTDIIHYRTGKEISILKNYTE